MKKLITSVIAVLALIAVVAPTKPAEAQVVLVCGGCCDVNPYTGGPRLRCTLVDATPCGNTCVCFGVAGSGFAC